MQTGFDVTTVLRTYSPADLFVSVFSRQPVSEAWAAADISPCVFDPTNCRRRLFVSSVRSPWLNRATARERILWTEPGWTWSSPAAMLSSSLYKVVGGAGAGGVCLRAMIKLGKNDGIKALTALMTAGWKRYWGRTIMGYCYYLLGRMSAQRATKLKWAGQGGRAGERATAEVCPLADGQLAALRGTEHDDLRLLGTLTLFPLLLKETAEAPSTSRHQSTMTEILVRRFSAWSFKSWQRSDSRSQRCSHQKVHFPSVFSSKQCTRHLGQACVFSKGMKVDVFILVFFICCIIFLRQAK